MKRQTDLRCTAQYGAGLGDTTHNAAKLELGLFVLSAITQYVSSISEGMFNCVNPALCNRLLT